MRNTTLGLLFLAVMAVAACSQSDAGDDNQSNVNNVNNFNNNNNMMPVCGNGVIEHPFPGDLHEDCDGTNLADQTCEGLGWDGGTLGCTGPGPLGTACRFDTSDCTGTNPCGNGLIDMGEVCDGTNLNGETCSSLTDGYYEGPLYCMPYCRWFNLSRCEPVGDRCGNGIVDQEGSHYVEACDDGLDNSDTRPDACRTNCTYPICGDGVIDVGEECDDGLENSNTLPDACRNFCITYADCTCRRAFCGDDVKDTGEECDRRDLGGQTCADRGFSGGVLACAADCTFDTSGCAP